MKGSKRNSLHGVIQTACQSLKDGVFGFQSFILNLLWPLSHHLVYTCGSLLSPQKQFSTSALPIPPCLAEEGERILLS